MVTLPMRTSRVCLAFIRWRNEAGLERFPAGTARGVGCPRLRHRIRDKVSVPSAERENQIAHVVRQRRGETHGVVRLWMWDYQMSCVQGLTTESCDRFLELLVRNSAPLRTGVDRIADDGMADRFEMDADLVRAAGAENAADHRGMAKLLDHFEIGDGVAAAGDDGHALAVARIARDRRVDRAARLRWSSVNDGQILFAHGLGRPRGGEFAMRRVVLRDHHHAARVFVEPVDDSGTKLAANSAEIAHVKQKRVDERAVGVAGGGMDHHSGRFVDDHKIAVFKKNRERNLLRLGGGGGGNGDVDGGVLPMRDAYRRPRRGPPVEHDSSLFDETSEEVSAMLRHSRGKGAVESGTFVFSRKDDVHDRKTSCYNRIVQSRKPHDSAA